MRLDGCEIRWEGRLRDVSVRLRRGERIGICGPNGAGKSSLLACLAGIASPPQGVVRLGGTPIEELSAAERSRRIGFLPQGAEVAWDVAVEVLVGLGRLPWRGEPGNEMQAAIDRAIAAMDLEDKRHRPVSQLSGGERARALMARVLATEPEWLLADEPLASLDIVHAAALMRRFRKEADSGRGVVLVLHDLATAMNHVDRVIVLDRGAVVADGAPELALASTVLDKVWGIGGVWLGPPGARALSLEARD